MRCAALAAVAALALVPAARGADLFVDAAIGSDANAGLSWGAPKATVLAALAEAALTPEADVVSVAAGTYVGDIDVPPDVTLMGGFASGGATRDIATYRTTLMGEGDGPVVTFGAGTDACVLDGFEVTGGWSDGTWFDPFDSTPEYPQRVGGIAVIDASPAIRRCLIQANEGLECGGVFAIGSASVIEDCVVQGNAGIALRARYRSGQVGQVRIDRSVFAHNRTRFVPGLGYFSGMAVDLPASGARTLMDGCRVIDNAVIGDVPPEQVLGEALHVGLRARSSERWQVRNSVFTTTGRSAMLFMAVGNFGRQVACDLDNCLIAGVALPDGYTVIRADQGVSCHVTNSTIPDGPRLVTMMGGSLAEAADVFFDRCILPTLIRQGPLPSGSQSNCLVMDSSTCAGCTNVINADPLFVPGPAHDYYLSDVTSGQAATSPAVDQGPITSAEAGLDGCTTRTDGGADTGLVDWGYHDCGIVAGGPWAGEPVPPMLEIWRGRQADLLTLWTVTTRLPWFEQRDTAPDTVGAGRLLFYDVRDAVAPIHVARAPENASVVLSY